MEATLNYQHTRGQSQVSSYYNHRAQDPTPYYTSLLDPLESSLVYPMWIAVFYVQFQGRSLILIYI